MNKLEVISDAMHECGIIAKFSFNSKLLRRGL